MNFLVALGAGRGGVAAGANAEELPLGVATDLTTTLPIDCHRDQLHADCDGHTAETIRDGASRAARNRMKRRGWN